MTAKIVNYTPEMTAELKAGYVANPTKATVEAFATKFGKTTKSIVAKLSREGVYVKAEKVTKAGEPIVKKDAMVEMIANEIGVTSDKLDGLEKAPKAVLKLVYAALATATEVADSE